MLRESNCLPAIVRQRRTQAGATLPDLLRGPDSNRRPAGYGPAELPTALPRDKLFQEPMPKEGIEPSRAELTRF